MVEGQSARGYRFESLLRYGLAVCCGLNFLICEMGHTQEDLKK